MTFSVYSSLRATSFLGEEKLSNKFNVFYVTLTGNSWPTEVQNKRKAPRKKHRSGTAPGEGEDGLKVHRMEKVCKGRIGNTVKCKAVHVHQTYFSSNGKVTYYSK